MPYPKLGIPGKAEENVNVNVGVELFPVRIEITF